MMAHDIEKKLIAILNDILPRDMTAKERESDLFLLGLNSLNALLLIKRVEEEIPDAKAIQLTDVYEARTIADLTKRLCHHQEKQQASAEVGVWIANIRFWMIFAVVLGHYCIEHDWATVSYEQPVIAMFSHLLHFFGAPTFIILLGFFAERQPKPMDVDITIRYALLPYVMFNLLSMLLLNLWGYPQENLLFHPIATSWFFLAVLVYRMIFPYLIRCRYPLIIALAIGLLSGAIPALSNGADSVFRLNRIFGYLPLFMFGHFMKTHGMVTAKGTIGFFLSVIILVFLIINTWLIHVYQPQLLLASYCYHDYGYFQQSVWMGMLARSYIYLLFVFCFLLLLRLVPDRRTIYSRFGYNSLFILIYHPLLVFFVSQWGFYDSPIDGKRMAMILVMALLTTLLTGTQWLRKASEKVLNALSRLLLVKSL